MDRSGRFPGFPERGITRPGIPARRLPARRGRASGWRDRGFTVTEVLVVLAVILILIALLIPRLLREVERTEATLIIEEWRLLREAVLRYEVDAGDPLDGWLAKPGMPPVIKAYVGNDILWENPNLGLRKSFVRLPAPHLELGWQTVFLVSVDRPSRLIDVLREVHEGRQTAYIPGRTIGLIID